MIISFLRTLYQMDQHTLGAFSEQDYRELLDRIEAHAIGPQVYSLLQRKGYAKAVPHFFRERLSHVYESCFFQNLLIKHETEQLLQQLDAAGIAVIPLKGTLMAERFFGHFAARGTSDIDLLVRPEQLVQATAVLNKAGFNQPAEENPVHYHTEWMKPAPHQFEPLVAELHWSFVPETGASFQTDGPWQHSLPLPGYERVRQLTLEFTFYTLCLHGSSHQMECCRYVLDLVQLLSEHAEHIQLSRILAIAEQDHTAGRVKAALSITYALFPELERIAPLPFKPTMQGWKGTLEPSSRLRQWLFQLRVLDRWSYRFAHLLRLILPSRSVAAYSLDDPSPPGTVTGMYIKLYRQRLRRLFGG